MFKSQEVLSIKIKAFEKKYVETYLQDKTRLERSKETLDELLRRSQAVLEMKSKVVLYKEFLKILCEDDTEAELKIKLLRLTCDDDCQKMEEIHKNTIKMWKVLFYWSKKRQACFTTPFLEFDLKIILKAISKVTRFIADQGKESEIVAYKAQPVTRAINAQVKDTAVIVEFVKDMNKDTLKQRHWY
jgi:pyruvate/2-oxoglutarate dehydrogenase complex dihydrolipoamide acyltransferase (E2) component